MKSSCMWMVTMNGLKSWCMWMVTVSKNIHNACMHVYINVYVVHSAVQQRSFQLNLCHPWQLGEHYEDTIRAHEARRRYLK